MTNICIKKAGKLNIRVYLKFNFNNQSSHCGRCRTRPRSCYHSVVRIYFVDLGAMNDIVCFSKSYFSVVYELFDSHVLKADQSRD